MARLNSRERTGWRQTEICKRLATDYALAPAEAERLFADVAANLRVVQRDITACLESEDFAALGYPARTLTDLACNLDQDDLRKVGLALLDATASQNPAQARRALQALNVLLRDFARTNRQRTNE